MKPRMPYAQAAHAMQSGVKFMMARNTAETDPKHLRVGINSAMVNDAALATLLIRKGIITADEYSNAVEEEMNNEVERYEIELSAMMGARITLK